MLATYLEFVSLTAMTWSAATTGVEAVAGNAKEESVWMGPAVSRVVWERYVVTMAAAALVGRAVRAILARMKYVRRKIHCRVTGS